MGLNLAQIFLRNLDFGAFLKSAIPAWTAFIESDTEPRRRQLLVLFRQPWIALVDSTGDLPKTFAVELSQATGGEAIRISVSSTTLTAEISRVVSGETEEDHVFPPVEEAGVMPLYVDAEMVVWNALRKMDVPAELRLLRVRDISARAIKKDEPADLVLIERKAPGEPVGHGPFISEFKEPRTEETGPPAEFSIFKSHEKMLADLYNVTVTTDADRVDNLLQVLEEIARRKPRPPLHHYMAAVSPEIEDETKRQEALAFLRERYRELAKTRPLAFTL